MCVCACNGALTLFGRVLAGVPLQSVSIVLKHRSVCAAVCWCLSTAQFGALCSTHGSVRYATHTVVFVRRGEDAQSTQGHFLADDPTQKPFSHTTAHTHTHTYTHTHTRTHTHTHTHTHSHTHARTHMHTRKHDSTAPADSVVLSGGEAQPAQGIFTRGAKD